MVSTINQNSIPNPSKILPNPHTKSIPNGIKRQSKIYLKSINNPPKSVPKSIENPSKIASKSISGASWLPSSIFLRFWSPPGRHLARLGASWGPSWRQVGLQKQSKTIKNLSQNPSKIRCLLDASWHRFFFDFRRIFAPKMEPSWHENRSKINANFERPFFRRTYKNQWFFNDF